MDFVRWAAVAAPAERYALVMWNRGGGWSPEDLKHLYVDVRGARPGRVGGRRIEDTALREMAGLAGKKLSRALFSTTVRTALSAPTAGERAICADDGTGHSLDTIEVGNVLRAARQAVGARIDLFGMDACLMSELEVTYQARRDVDAVVGSEAEEPGAGWPYAQVLEALNRRPSMDGAELGGAVVEAYVASYRRARSVWPVTQCAVRTSEMTAFTKAMDGLARALRAELPSNWAPIYTAHTQSTEFGGVGLCDLVELCSNLESVGTRDETKAAAAGVREALEPGGYIVAEGHLTPARASWGGVTIFMPAPSDQVSKYYGDLAFAKSHGWDGFLTAYHDAVTSRRR